MATITPWADNAPVQITWGRQPQTIMTWYGYVNHHKMATIADSGTHNLQYTYYCIGTSKPMNTVASKAWGSVTPTYIAQQMAAKYSLRCVVTSTTWVLTNEVQANETDFQYMNRVASKTGYRFWVSGGTMYFIDPAVVLVATSTQLVPNYFMYKRLDWQDTIRDFQKYQGDNLPGSQVATRNLYGIDPLTGAFFTATAGIGHRRPGQHRPDGDQHGRRPAARQLLAGAIAVVDRRHRRAVRHHAALPGQGGPPPGRRHACRRLGLLDRRARPGTC